MSRVLEGKNAVIVGAAGGTGSGFANISPRREPMFSATMQALLCRKKWAEILM